MRGGGASRHAWLLVWLAAAAAGSVPVAAASAVPGQAIRNLTPAQAFVAQQLVAALTRASSGDGGVTAADAPPVPAGLAAVNVSQVAGRIVAAAVASFQTSVSYAATNRGLAPQRIIAFGRTHFYQIPADPIGTVAFFPGCSRASAGFFPYDPLLCAECLGLPEELAHTKQALARGYAVLAPTNKDTRTLCWSSSGDSDTNDQAQALSILAEFLIKNGLADKPVYALGVSSGGTLSLKLPRYIDFFKQRVKCNATMPPPPKPSHATGSAGPPPPLSSWNGSNSLPPPLVKTPPPGPACLDPFASWKDIPDSNSLAQIRLSGIITEVATPPPEVWGVFKKDNRTLRFKPWPPTVFIMMEGDIGGSVQAAVNVALLRHNKVPSGFILSPERVVSPSYFSNRIPVVTPEQSLAIVAAMQQVGLLDSQGWLVANPKEFLTRGSPAFRWTASVQRLLPWLADTSQTLSLLPRRSAIFQELNVAYAGHETVADYMTACLMWLESGGTADLQALKKRHSVANLAALTMDRLYPPPAPPTPPPPPPRPPQPPPQPLPPGPRPPNRGGDVDPSGLKPRKPPPPPQPVQRPRRPASGADVLRQAVPVRAAAPKKPSPASHPSRPVHRRPLRRRVAAPPQHRRRRRRPQQQQSPPARAGKPGRT